MKLNHMVMLFVAATLCASPVFAKKEKEKELPQGLQKKLDRGGSLPPGWQKKLVKGEPMEEAIYQQSEVVIPLDSDGLLTVRVEGKLVKLVEATREVVEILDILN